MNVFGLAKFNTSKMHKTSKPQTNVPVKICHFKVVYWSPLLRFHMLLALNFHYCISAAGDFQCLVVNPQRFDWASCSALVVAVVMVIVWISEECSL